jgi:hypothetical protein
MSSGIASRALQRILGANCGFEFGGSVGHFKRSNLTAQRSWMLAD